jgi:hypothetical protein
MLKRYILKASTLLKYVEHLAPVDQLTQLLKNIPRCSSALSNAKYNIYLYFEYPDAHVKRSAVCSHITLPHYTHTNAHTPRIGLSYSARDRGCSFTERVAETRRGPKSTKIFLTNFGRSLERKSVYVQIS